MKKTNRKWRLQSHQHYFLGGAEASTSREVKRKWRLQSHMDYFLGGAEASTSRGGFSMIELIFIIIILGVLGATIQMNMPDNRLLSDRNFILQKIKEKQMFALGYDNFDYASGEFNDDKTCITINKDIMNNIEKNSSKPYKIRATIDIDFENICFDNFGRPYNGDKLNNFLKMPIELNITYKGKTKRVNIMPFSGAVIKK